MIEEETIDFQEALSDKKLVQAKVEGWFVDRGFGFVSCNGCKAFCHAKSIRGGEEALLVGSWVMVRVMRDTSRPARSFRVSEAWKPEHLAEDRRIKNALKRQT